MEASVILVGEFSSQFFCASKFCFTHMFIIHALQKENMATVKVQTELVYHNNTSIKS